MLYLVPPLFVYASVYLSQVEGGEVFVSTSLGVIKGVEKLSRGGNTYYSFTGVPYAEPPIGDLRFQSPKPPKDWTGIWDATQIAPKCLHIGNFKEIYGQEDCLYLNVFTPSLYRNNVSLPVMVYIYGSRYWLGDGGPTRYGPEYLMDHPIIFVTFNYRLGPLGFLSTEDSTIPGNYGLKDVVAVLHWVREHISNFNGDPTNVTLSGGSSGATSASLAMFSPLTKGLFHRCVSHSGHALRSGTFLKPGRSRKQAWILGHAVGCQRAYMKTSEQLLRCLKKIPGEKLVKLNHDFFDVGWMLPEFIYGPVVEPKSEPNAFITENPVENLTGKLRKIGHLPWLLGINTDDGGLAMIGYFSDPNTAKEIVSNYEEYMPRIFNYGRSKDSNWVSGITERIVNRYFENGIVSLDYRIWTKMFTESSYMRNLKKLAKWYGGPIYFYYYNYNHTHSMAKLYGNLDHTFRAIHGDEIFNFFLWSEMFPMTTQGRDRTLSERMLKLWINFMTYGNPNKKGKKEIWPQFNSDYKMRYLNITTPKFEVGKYFMKEEIEFWDEIYSSENLEP